ncbi:NAD(P)-binding protein [Dothidotthia symphoricarpi CBS 119687]|uniref:NAD(P)-binding protein n=1 Tax=Dothidotthia symphoricarpi CBS 119687 TaxID=1392245 RepID=A0A6A6A2C8_9PLEO|nr:NAD(P)-binding protein [Dothidotthia symphoricarpi CBS 119687]KAF2125057.1 NAD(P)-binding protein [Dothidotthia symphoricarpi CBS 119687]
MATTKSILITGATGKQGGSVLKQLATHPSSSQFTLLAVTRNASAASAQRITENHPGVILVQGDLNDVPALFAAAKTALKEAGKSEQIWGVYSVQISMGPGVTVESEVKQGTQLIDESLKEGVTQFVYSSVDRGGNERSFETGTPIPHFQSKHTIEQHLLEKAGKEGENMGWTILRPVAFMDNLAPGVPTKVFLAALRDTLQGKPLQWVSTEDIGLFGATAFAEHEEWTARTEGLAGSELTFDEMSGCFERVLGFPAPATYGVFGSVLKWAVTEMSIMITWFATDGYGVDIGRLKKEEPRLCDFETWLRERSGWKAQAIAK